MSALHLEQAWNYSTCLLIPLTWNLLWCCIREIIKTGVLHEHYEKQAKAICAKNLVRLYFQIMPITLYHQLGKYSFSKHPDLVVAVELFGLAKNGSQSEWSLKFKCM